MAEGKQIILVTGANSGIGYEFALQLLQDPSKHVILGCRSEEKGALAVKRLHAQGLPGSVEALLLDVASPESIASSATLVATKYSRLDALVNNAGIGPPDSTLAEQMAVVYKTNVTGPLLTVEAFAPLLLKSSRTPRIVNISSNQGSIGLRPDETIFGHSADNKAYRASKAALNMITACQAWELGGRGVKVFSYCPGFTISEMTPFNRAENGARPTADAAAPIVNILSGARDAEAGQFLHGEGQYPW